MCGARVQMNVLAVTCAEIALGSVGCTDLSASAMTASCGSYGTFDLSLICPSGGCDGYFTVNTYVGVPYFFFKLQSGGLPPIEGAACNPASGYTGKVLGRMAGGCGTYGSQSSLATWEIVENSDARSCAYYGGTSSQICMKLTFGDCSGEGARCTDVIVSCNSGISASAPVQSQCVDDADVCRFSTIFIESSYACDTSTVSTVISSTTASTSIDQNGGLSGGAIGGIVGGSVGFFVLVGVVVYYFVMSGPRSNTSELYSPLQRNANF